MDNRKVIYLDDAIDALMQLSSAQYTVESEVVTCKDCIHRPVINDQDDIGGFKLRFPDDSKCPCRCDDAYYSWMPNDNWFCGNGEKEEKNERKSRKAGSGEAE